MNQPKTDEQEPSMEEILASIRRIISEDGSEDDAAAPAASAETDSDAVPQESEGPEEDVLELTNVVDEPAGSEPATEPEPAPSPLTVVDTEATEVAEPGLVSEDTETVTSAALSRLMSTGPENDAFLSNTTAMGAGDKTIEGIVVELLRPMLKEWLDRNLPQVVERIVEREIERVGRSAGQR